MYSDSIQAYNDQNAQTEWERLDRHKMEFAITCRALGEFLPPAPGRVLDCGGGPGRYAIHLAQAGYVVTLFDLSAQNLALAQQKAAEARASVESFVQGSALDLSQFAGDAFDSVLLLGPLYHLLEASDRLRAVREALRVLKPGGRLLAGFITLFAAFRDPIAKGYLRSCYEDPGMVQNMLQTHVNPPDKGFTAAWFSHPDEIRPLMEMGGCRTLTMLGVEGLVDGHEEHINAAEPAVFDYWVDLITAFAMTPAFGARRAIYCISARSKYGVGQMLPSSRDFFS